jgi:NadR type nicotinamide-nucleotide adenylyltransferase
LDKIKKIVVIGPESTGKSTLSQSLATALNTVFVPEYARTYLEQQQNNYNYTDLLPIAKGQISLEDDLINQANRILICDTDLYVIKVWSEHKYQKVDPYILNTIAERKYDGYILCDIDMAWEYDPQREHPDASMRTYFYHQYLDIVQATGAPFIIVSEDPAARLHQALNWKWLQGIIE